MEYISQTYRKACREICLSPEGKTLFMRLLREISVNAVRSRKNWHSKEDFICLWFMSVGRFPGMSAHPYGEIITEWVARQLPFELNNEEKLSLLN